MVPSQRFRFEQYLDLLKQNNYSFTVSPFLAAKAYPSVYQSGNILSKIRAITHSYIKRYLLLFTAGQYTFIFIHREATPAGPPVVEWILAKVLRKKIIYD